MNKPIEHTSLTTLPMWIDGKSAPSSGTRFGEVTNPATGQVIRRVPLCNAEDIGAAVCAASLW